MLFVIHALDKAGGSTDQRKEHYPAHHAFLADHAKLGVKIVMSGPLVANDGATPVGSHFVIEAPDRTTAEAFHHADPFYKVGVWGNSTVTPFIKKIG